jgi:hypothetical protein
METIGISILWLFAFLQVLNVVIVAMLQGKPKVSNNKEYTASDLYIAAGAAILVVYAVVLVSAGR